MEFVVIRAYANRMKQTYTIKELAKEERPYEKCEAYGASSLSNIELLAVLLRNGTKGGSSLDLAKQLLYSADSEGELLSIRQWTYQQLIKIKGIGKVKAIQILCLSELTRRLAKAEALKGLNFSRPSTIADYYMEDMRHKRQEHLKLLMLNTRSRLIGEANISVGTVNSALISPRELFIEALQKNAVYIILLHNHPSGDPIPSKEDIQVTKMVQESGRLIGIELLDHIIIGNNCYISLIEKGFL